VNPALVLPTRTADWRPPFPVGRVNKHLDAAAGREGEDRDFRNARVGFPDYGSIDDRPFKVFDKVIDHVAAAQHSLLPLPGLIMDIGFNSPVVIA
jgi:hypothetical protein